MTFRELHQTSQPLLLCNVWDVASAKLAQKMGFSAIGTSSAAIARTLGYEDGEDMPFLELYRCVQKIVAHINIPLSVDIESGYSRDPIKVAEHITALSKLGVQGVNIEDSVVEQQRRLINANTFTHFLAAIVKQLKVAAIEVFINVRTDVYLCPPKALPVTRANTQSSMADNKCLSNDLVSEAKARIELYQRSGVDGIFVPAIEAAVDIAELTRFSTLPLNVMCMPNLADFTTLTDLGVKRISMGNFLYENMHQHLENTLAAVLSDQSFKGVF